MRGWQPETFASARDFLSRPRFDHLITDYGDVPMTVRAMKAGAIEFLTKPFKDEVLDAGRKPGTTRREGGTTEVTMSGAPIDLKLEVIVIPVSDVDRAKRFYETLEWRLDADFPGPDN